LDDNQALENLRPAEASHESDHTKHIDRAYKGTRKTLLDELGVWAHSLDPKEIPVYVLMGEAGTGKSAIAKEMAHRLKGDEVLGCSFFFKGGEDSLSRSRVFFKTIAHNLALSHEEIYPHVVSSAHAHHHLRLGQNTEMQYQVADLLDEPLAKVPAGHKPVVIIVDAPDECAEDPSVIREMLKLLTDIPAKAKFPLRILITTRPEKHIYDLFHSNKMNGRVHVKDLHTIPKSNVIADIASYLSARIEKSDLPDDFLQSYPDAVQRLARRADGFFIYAKVAIDFISLYPTLTDQHLKLLYSDDRASQTSAGPAYAPLDELYGEVLQKAFSDKTPLSVKKSVQEVLGAIAILKDSLSAKVMTDLLKLDIKNVCLVVDNLRSVILQGEDGSQDDRRAYGKILPIHSTFIQYLTDHTRCKSDMFYIDPAEHH
ncbi:hypothetical protein OBBRIDRAFT_713677, partial [Obba rivulosa]